MQPAIGKVEVNVAHSIGADRSRGGARREPCRAAGTLQHRIHVPVARGSLRRVGAHSRRTNRASLERACGAKHRLHLVAGICERAGAKLFNSAVLIGPDGYIGTFRKVHLWNEENLYFEPGDLGFPVFHTTIGRIGMAICYDGWFPETYRLARSRAPTSSACRQIGFRFRARPKAARRWRTFSQWPRRIRIRSTSPAPTGLATERGQPFEGQSLIVGHTGWPVAGPASRDKEEILIAEVALGEARRARNWNAFNQVLRDRRVRSSMTRCSAASIKRGWY